TSAETLGTRSCDREAALAERDRPAAVALRAGRERRPGRAPVPVTGGTDLCDRERDRHLPGPPRHPARHGDHGLEAPAPLLAPSASEDRREDVSQPEPAQVA